MGADVRLLCVAASTGADAGMPRNQGRFAGGGGAGCCTRPQSTAGQARNNKADSHEEPSGGILGVLALDLVSEPGAPTNREHSA